MGISVLPEKFQSLQSFLEGIGVQTAGYMVHGKGQVQEGFFKTGLFR